MTAVDFAKIRNRNRETRRVVHVEAWGGDVTLERMTPAERIDLMLAVDRAGLVDDEGNVEMSGETISIMAEAVSKSITNGDGVREFDSEEGRADLMDHIEAVVELVSPVLELNGIGSASDDDAKKKTTATENYS